MTFTVLPAKVTLSASAPAVKVAMTAVAAANVFAHLMAFISISSFADLFLISARLAAARFMQSLACGSGVACLGGFRAFGLVVVLVHGAAARRALHRKHGRRPVHRAAPVFHIARYMHDGTR